MSDSATMVTAVAAVASVVLTLLGVLVAVFYAYLTWRLANAAKIQAAQGKVLAQAAEQQAAAALEQAVASRKGAEAAVAQARVTRQMFEASHRPYLEVRLERRSFYLRPGFFGVVLSVKNHGPVPAILLGWRADVQVEHRTVHQQPPTDEGLCVFPGKDAELECRGDGTGRMDEQPHPHADIHIEVPYRGFDPDIRYETKIGAVGRFNQWGQIYEDVT